MVTEREERTLLWVAGAGAAALVVSIVVANVVGELSDALWVLVVPIGMLGGLVVLVVALGMLFARRVRS